MPQKKFGFEEKIKRKKPPNFSTYLPPLTKGNPKGGVQESLELQITVWKILLYHSAVSY